jgi:hypothetical protein
MYYLFTQGGNKMSALKIKEFSGRIAPETIEKHTMEQSLRDAQYALDVQLHDLRSESCTARPSFASSTSMPSRRLLPHNERTGQAVAGSKPVLTTLNIVKDVQHGCNKHYHT